MGETIEFEAKTLDRLNRMIWDFEGENAHSPSVIIMHPETHYQFVKEIVYLYGVMINDEYLRWQGIRIVRSVDVKLDEIILA